MSEAALSASSQNHMQAQMPKEASANNSNDLAEQMFSQYGVQNVLSAVTNAASDYLKKELSALIESMDMPQFMKDDAMKQLNSVGDSYLTDTPKGAQDGVDDVLSQSSGGSKSKDDSSGGSQSAGGSSSSGSNSGADDVMKGTMDMIKKSMQDSTESASQKGGGTGGGTGNWLAVLAKALGQTAGKHLKSMVDLGNKMGGLDSKENPEEFAKIQAEFQAEAQIFKMFQEAIGTMIKSIGEGMSSVARKQ